MINDSDSLQFNWTWQRAVYLRAQREMWKRRLRKRSHLWLVLGLLAVAALFVGYALSRSAVGTASFVAFVVVAGALGGKVGERVQWRLQARSFERRCLPKYASMLYVLDSSGFRIQNGDTDLHIGWSAFDRWTESDEFLLLFTGPAVGYYLPKQAASPGDLPRALELLSRSIP